MKPGWQRLTLRGLTPRPNESEKDRLEGVLGVGVMRQELPADRPDQRTVPTDQFLERPLVAMANEAVEQVGVGRPGIRHPNHGL